MKLTKQQAEYLPAIRWLLDQGPRASGKSYLLACVYIEKAIKYKQPICVWDHNSVYNSGMRADSRYMLYIIEAIFNSDPELYENYDLEISVVRQTIRIEPKVNCNMLNISWSFK